MTKDDILKELYEIISEISAIPPQPYKMFYSQHKNDSEHELVELLRVARQVINKK